MSFRNVMLHLDTSPTCPKRIEVALEVAKRFGAHISALFAETDTGFNKVVQQQSSLGGLPSQSEDLKTHTQECAAAFRGQCASAGVTCTVEILEPRSHNYITNQVMIAAREADLAILGQNDPDNNRGRLPENLAEDVMLHAGRPVLVVPYVGVQGSFGKRALVAWNWGRESARALNDALPFLKQADLVQLFTIDSEKQERRSGDQAPEAAIARHLGFHEIETQICHQRENKGGVANMLLSHCADEGIDLLVMGGHGHYSFSILRGSNTRDILRSMTVPVLMSH